MRRIHSRGCAEFLYLKIFGESTHVDSPNKSLTKLKIYRNIRPNKNRIIINLTFT